MPLIGQISKLFRRAWPLCWSLIGRNPQSVNLWVGAVLLEGACYTHCWGGRRGVYTLSVHNHLKVHFRDKWDFKPGHHFRAYWIPLYSQTNGDHQNVLNCQGGPQFTGCILVNVPKSDLSKCTQQSQTTHTPLTRGGTVLKKYPNRSVRLSRFGSCVRCTVRRMRNVAPCSVSREHTYSSKSGVRSSAEMASGEIWRLADAPASFKSGVGKFWISCYLRWQRK